MTIEDKLTPEQIKNWREILVGQIGPYASIMSDEAIQAMRDMMQTRVDEIAEEMEEDDQ